MSSSGPNYAASCVDGGGGASSWTNPANARAADGVYATVGLSGSATNFLSWSDFGFSIPSGSTINGIELEVNRKSTTVAGNGDADVRLVVSGVRVGSDRHNGYSLPTTAATAVYGGPSDLWGTTWSASDVNASGFGAAWSCGGIPGQTVSVDYARVTVYYTASSGETVSASSLAGSGSVSTASASGGSSRSASALAAAGVVGDALAATGSGVSHASPSLAGSGSVPSPAVRTGQTASPPSLAASGVAAAPTVKHSVSHAASPLAGSSGLSAALASGSIESSAAAAPLVGVGLLADPASAGSEGGAAVDPEPGYLAGRGLLSDASLVVADCLIVATAAAGSSGLPDVGRTVDPLAASGSVVSANILAPPNLYAYPAPLAAPGGLGSAEAAYGRTTGAAALAGAPGLPTASAATNGSTAAVVGPLVGQGRIGASSGAWPGWTGAGLVYSIYGNDGVGGPIDYSEPIAQTADLSWTVGPLAYPGDYKFGQRTSSLKTGLEEKNLDAQIRLILDGAGRDATRRPFAPVGLRAAARAGGGCRVEWSCPWTDPATRPVGFRVYSGPSGAVDYGTVHAEVPYSGSAVYSVDLAGFLDGVEYSVGVRSYNATAEETNTVDAEFTADSTGPAAVGSLTASPV